MKITLVRHAEVEDAYRNCYNGHNDVGLSFKGEAQAKLLAEEFKDKNFDRIYCSDLKRAKETLRPFRQAKDALYTKDLREKSWGKYEGLSFEEIIAKGEIVYENFEQWIEALGGEDYREYSDRVEHFFFSFLPEDRVENLLIVTHAGVIRTLISIVKQIPLEEAFCVELSYGSYLIFDTNERSFTQQRLSREIFGSKEIGDL